MTQSSAQQLKKVLRPVHLWGIAVSLVISGEYFGWNYGWGVAGTVGFLIATLIVTLLYVTFIFSYTELTTSIPHAGGAFAYAYKAMGPIGGLIAGYSVLIDLILASASISLSLGAYVHFLYPGFSVFEVALFFYLIFTVLNIGGVRESAAFSILMAILAVGELLIFMGIIAPHFKMENFLAHSSAFGWKGIFAALPFAIWFYLAIEGVAMVAEEVKDPKRDVPKGYLYGLGTLILLVFGVSILTGGITDWRKLSNLDYPLPEAIGIVLGKTSGITKLFAGIGLFGLIASFHGTILAYSRQVLAMARIGYLPRFLAALNPRFKTPHWATIGGGIIGAAAIFYGDTTQLITIAVAGAVLMYIICMVSLFVFRIKHPDLRRPFSSPFYPVFPAIALGLSVLCMVSIIYYNLLLSLIFFAGLAAVILIFMLMGKHKHAVPDDLLLDSDTAPALQQG